MYLTLAELKAELDITGTENDTILIRMIEDAQAVVERETGRVWEAGTDSTRHTGADRLGSDGRRLYFDRNLAGITAITSATGVPVTGYHTLPRNEGPYYAIETDGAPFLAVDMPLAVTGQWAESLTAPADIRHLTMRVASWMWHQRKNGTDGDRPILADGVTYMPGKLPGDISAAFRRYRVRL